MFHINLVEDSDFTEIELPRSSHEGEKVGFKYTFNNSNDYKSEIVIAPHYNETYISLELFKLALYCKKNKIKVTSIGSMNQFTFFGLFSDEVICLKDTHLHNIYSSNYSSFGTDASYFNQIPNFKDIYGGGMGMYGFPEVNQISIDEVIDNFKFPPIFLRKSTLDFFKTLSLPSDIIYCEIKTHFYPRLKNIINNNFPHAVGVDKNFQRDLLQKSGDHFMGVQLLASLFKGWQFVAAGGSVNLLNVLPVRPLCFLENDNDLTEDFIKAATVFANERYGAKPNFINFSPRICANEVPEEKDSSLGPLETTLPESIKKSFKIALESRNKITIANNPLLNSINLYTPKKENFNNEISIKIGNKIINWIFQYNHDFNFFKRNILDWAVQDYEYTNANPDFTVAVYINDQTILEKISNLSSQKFLLSSEAHTRHPVLNNCHSFVQDARPHDDHSYIRYAPTMCCWSPPMNKSNSTIRLLSSLQNPPNLVSATDSGRYSWRNDMTANLSKKLGGKIDLFGGGYKQILGGYHHNTTSHFLNEKYISLLPYFFSLAIENKTALHSKEDYITEKVTDPILCETLPICQSAPNLSDYFIDGSYITLETFLQLDVKNLASEYIKRRPSILEQKQFLKNTLNVFSYFHKLTDDLSLLDKLRPITLK